MNAQALTRIENKLERLSDGFRDLSGGDAQELSEDFSELAEVSRKRIIDLGHLVLIRAIKVKLHVFQLMEELTDMAMVEDATATVDEVEQFYADLEREWSDRKSEGDRLEGYQHGQLMIDWIPPLPEAEKSGFVELDLSGVPHKGLFKSITGFFSEEPTTVGVEIPQELLNLAVTIDFEKLSAQVLENVGIGGASVRDLARMFAYGKRSLAIVFLACLFLEASGSVRLVQSGEDILILRIVSKRTVINGVSIH